MDSFSWSDTIQATLKSCLPCLIVRAESGLDADEAQQSNNSWRNNLNNPNDTTANRAERARPDELEGLLADSDALSLHTNPGDRRRKAKTAAKAKKSIRVFGFDLFGRPRQPISLPEDEEGEDPLHRSRRTSSTTATSSTFDSDASPLDPTIIDAQLAAQVLGELKQKEQERQKRRERRERKRLARSLAAGGDGNEFEGFQGSGDIIHRPASISEEYGPYVEAALPPPAGGADDDEADLDGFPHFCLCLRRAASAVLSPTPAAATPWHDAETQDQKGEKPELGIHFYLRTHTISGIAHEHVVLVPRTAPAPLENMGAGKFPSAGFAGTKGRSGVHAGAFLAVRGDE
ncbi:hypothetical protein BD779DRAFT_1673068 [Infundibulicybe gibba]|nr:hypothetical protein BD779DRAFT_1673068 [Infundibulicybe gibba]